MLCEPSLHARVCEREAARCERRVGVHVAKSGMPFADSTLRALPQRLPPAVAPSKPPRDPIWRPSALPNSTPSPACQIQNRARIETCVRFPDGSLGPLPSESHPGTQSGAREPHPGALPTLGRTLTPRHPPTPRCIEGAKAPSPRRGEERYKREKEMAAPVIAVERYRVEHGQGFTMPVISLTDRRAAGNRLVRFVFQRHLETVLYDRSEGSSGPIWKAMNAAGIGSTTMTINKAAVMAGLVTDDEFKAIMDTFKSALPADVVDPCSLGRIRNCTILPLAAAATVVRTFGRSPASMAWLRALSQPVPQ
eukprot:5048565-Prymnesium_polylepis.1